MGVRRREIGLRLALGAESENILKHFLAQGLGVAVAGALAGLALALASGRVLQGMLLYGVSPADPTTLAGVTLLVMVVTAAAALLPAIRAARVEPMHVLRQE